MADTKAEIEELLKKAWPEWRIVREIGAGSFGKVYEIRREDIGGTYEAALKVISIPRDKSEVDEIITEGMDEDSATRYFQSIMEELVKEFALMEKLKGNTNIVTYEDHKVVPFEQGIGWNIFIRMELLTPLTEYLKNHSMNESDVIKLGKDICRALELCQKHDIIHRDIKPENIFVSEYGDYKLGDFGIARTAEKTMAGMSKKGTYTYMAPEVYRGDAYNATVDIYSLGIVLYRLLNDNRAPFLPPYPQTITYSAREEAQRKRLSGEEFPRPAHGSEELAGIIKKACTYISGYRFKSAWEFRDALESIGDRAENITYQKQSDEEDIRTLMLPDDEEKSRTKKENNDKKEKKRVSTGKIAGIVSLLIAGVILFVAVLTKKNNEKVDGDAVTDIVSINEQEETEIQANEEQAVNRFLEMYVVDASEYPDYSYYSVPEVSEEEHLGDQCFFQEKYEEAVQHYENVGDLPRALYKIGKCYEHFQFNDVDEQKTYSNNAVNYIMRSAMERFPDALAELGLIMSGYYGDNLYSECCNYYNPETEGYEYWMNLAVENGYSKTLKDGYDLYNLFYNDASDMEINEFIDKEFKLAMRGSYLGCLDILTWYTANQEIREFLKESFLGDFEEEIVIDAVAKVVTEGEYNYATILSKERCVFLLGLWAARNEDYEMLEMIDEELEKIEKYIGEFNEVGYRDTALILAAVSYNSEANNLLKDYEYYMELAKESQPKNCGNCGAIIFMANGASIYDGYGEESRIVDYLQTDKDIYAVAVDDVYDLESGWYGISVTTLPQDEGAQYWIRQEDTMGISYVDEGNKSFGMGEELMSKSVSIESFLNLDFIEFTYIGYEVVDSYQDPDGLAEMYALEGDKLLVLKFLADNSSKSESNLDIPYCETKFKLIVNGEKIRPLTTMLSNDLVSYQGIIAPGENVELVLIAEVTGEQAESISSLEIMLENINDKATISLN